MRKPNIDVQDIEQLAQLKTGEAEKDSEKQDKGSFIKQDYDRITLADYKPVGSDKVTSNRSDAISSSTYDKKLETKTHGVTIVVKVKRGW